MLGYLLLSVMAMGMLPSVLGRLRIFGHISPGEVPGVRVFYYEACGEDTTQAYAFEQTGPQSTISVNCAEALSLPSVNQVCGGRSTGTCRIYRCPVIDYLVGYGLIVYRTGPPALCSAFETDGIIFSVGGVKCCPE